MIKFEITQSSDTLALGLYEYLFDQVFIGRSKKCDLIFIEKEFPLRYLTITANENALIIQSDAGAPPYFINGKKTNGAFKLKKNDLVILGSHQLKILDFKKTNLPTDLSPFYEKVPNASEKVKEALSFLEEKLIDLEEATDV